MNSGGYRIRRLLPDDYAHVGRIYFCAIHEGARNVYSYQQRLAWGGETINLDGWKDRLQHLDGFVAEEQGEPIGFMTVDEKGYVDLAFVLPSFARKGVGAQLLSTVEERARSSGAIALTTAASLASRPFFERHGWSVVEKEEVLRKGVVIERYNMRKDLCSVQAP